MQDVATVSIQAAKGEARTYIGTHQTSATDATPVDITGWTIVVTARRRISGPVVLSKIASLLSPTLGTYQFVVTAADSRLQAGSYPLDIWRTDTGSERQIGQGTWTITPVVRL